MNALLKKRTLVITLICVVTFICFRYTLGNQFTIWDDDYYVTNDPYIKAFTAENLKVIFTQDITKNNYHPLCMLSLAVNYFFAQLNPMTYYLTNILIHIANVLLVFFLFEQICVMLKTDEKAKLFIAGFGALWFGIHPMHVESVSWIAERKDVLYAFFYLLGLLAYLRFLKSDKTKWYWITFGLFLASCLSKPMAVVFPLSLLCVDMLMKRQLSQKLLVEKAVFFLFSLICGGMAFYTQNKTGAIASFGILTIQERFMYASYGFVMYVAKLFNPTELSTFYPYPYRFINGYLPSIYYAAPMLVAAIIGLPLFIAYKKSKENFRVALFGMGFFVANVIFVLQFISVGAAIMSDRYSYVAYIGLLFMTVYFLYEATKHFPAIKTVLTVALLVVSGVLSVLCYERTLVWHDSETLLTDAIERYPYRALLSYKWRGNYYFLKGELDKAMEDYNVLTTLHMADASVNNKIAQISMLKGTMPAGVAIPQAAQPVAGDDRYKANLDSSIAYSRAGDSVNAFKQYIKALRYNQGIEKTYAQTAFSCVQNKEYDAAIIQYNILMKINTSNPYYYFYRGVAYFSKNQMKTAIDDWQSALKMNNKDMEQSAAYNLSVAYDSVGNDSLAVYYVLMAKNSSYNVNEDFVEKLKKKNKTHLKH